MFDQTVVEKPEHLLYLNDFRVEQCTLFLQHKCPRHRPFTCFKWHFYNQRRRKPILQSDGYFNYFSEDYCSQYDENTGICPDGDECKRIHRNSGDTERRFHPRYLKICFCPYETDSRELCEKNGKHCSLAHNFDDIRSPIYDISELSTMNSTIVEPMTAKETINSVESRISMSNNWNDLHYVLANYKVEHCQWSSQLCRQGFGCPHYHNAKDRRRDPKLFKYRSNPCPSVKSADDWGDPSDCDSGDQCIYCHTRTEQQFHSEVFKSSPCNDLKQNGFCPRGVFCAFSHFKDEKNFITNAAKSEMALSPTGSHDVKSDAIIENVTSFDIDSCTKLINNMSVKPEEVEQNRLSSDENILKLLADVSRRVEELKNLSPYTLKILKNNLQSNLTKIENAIYLQPITKCLICEKHNRSVTLKCNHCVLCEDCAIFQTTCPYCNQSFYQS